MPAPRPVLALALALAACRSPRTDLALGSDPEPAEPAAPRPAEAPAEEASAPLEDPALAALRAEYPKLLALDAARDRDGWFDMARALADKESLGRHFKRVDYAPPMSSRALAVAVGPGVGQPRYFYYSFGETAFEVPVHYFHPASTVKLAASVGALRTVGTLGLTGDVWLEFQDGEGGFAGKLADSVHEALMHSSNRDYNRLVRIAGFDALNVDYLSPTWGLPEMAIQARYGSREGPTLRSSPAIRYREGDKAGEIPAREGTSEHPTCKGNCATLFELHDVQRRVLLHDALPEGQRFPIDARDAARMKETMRITRKRLGRVPEEAFGAPVVIYNNVGRIPRVALLENATIVEPRSGRRVFMVASVAFPGVLGDSDQLVVPRLRALVRPLLDLALTHPLEGPGLQGDAGVRPEVVVRQHAGDASSLLVEVRGRAGEPARAWLGRSALEQRAPGGFVAAGVRPGTHVVVVELGPEGAPVGYRASLVEVPGPPEAGTRQASRRRRGSSGR